MLLSSPTGVSGRHTHPKWTCLGMLVAAGRQHLSNPYWKQCALHATISVTQHVFGTSQTGDGFHRRDKKGSTLRTSTCKHVSNWLTMFNPDVRRYDTLTVPSRCWRMTQTMYMCPLQGEIRGQMMRSHVRPTLNNIPWDSFVRFKCGVGITVL